MKDIIIKQWNYLYDADMSLKIQIMATLVVVYVVTMVLLVQLRRYRTGLPVVKGGIPFIGHALVMLEGSPWDTMAKWVQEYGTMYCFHLFGTDAVVVSDPGALKVVLQTKLSKFRKDVQGTYKPFMVLLGKGLVTSEGAEWQRQRSLVSHALRIEILQEIPQMAVDAVGRLCDKLDQAAAKGQTIDMAEEFRHLTLQVIAEAILSLSPEESDATFAHMYLPIVEEGHRRTWNPVRAFLPTPAMWKFNQDVHALDDFVTNIIKARFTLRQREEADVKSGKGPTTRKMDILDRTMGAIDAAVWGPHTVRQIRDEVKTFILAGHETSASMLTWSLFELTCNKPLLERVRDEGLGVFGEGVMDTLMGKDDENRKKSRASLGAEILSGKQLDGLEFTQSCLKESLRKYSVVPTVVRVARESIKLKDHMIPSGSTIMINIQGVHHNPDFWPQPLTYDPERFYQRDYSPYTFLPFVEGARSCLGQFLSLLESKVVLALLLQRFDFVSVDPAEAAKKHPYMVPIIPKTGHIMKVTRRM